MTLNKTSASRLIKNKSMELGFMFCGISKAGKLETESRDLETFLNENRHGKMKWLENYFDLRTDPTQLFPGAKSVISLALNYFPKDSQNASSPQISKYAYGKDYHFIIKDKLKELLFYIQNEIGDVAGRAFVDSAPIMDIVWAKKSGIGWLGKHTNIINPKAGSFFFLGEVILDMELESDGQIKDYCGTCTKCIDAGPTDALAEPYKIDASKCISYFTIELKDQLPLDMTGKFDNWMFGCDICQDVCPWNRFSKPNKEEWFNPNSKLMEMKPTEWEELTQEVFSEIFQKSAVKRAKFSGLKRNIEFLKQIKTDN